MSSRVTACTSCRQVKLKCDVKETQPDACTRCRTRKLSCKMDPHFKRIPTRGRLAEVTQKLNNLQEVLAMDPRNRLLVADAASIAGSSSQQAYSNHSPSPMASGDQPQHGFTRNDRRMSTQTGTTVSSPQSSIDARLKGSCFFLEPHHLTQDSFNSRLGPKRLGDVIVKTETIEELFRHYYHYRHPHLPIVNTDVTVSRLYDSSRFLFWTILHISCRHNPHFAELEHNLTPPYKDLLATTLITAVTSLQTIQALLLLCLYPFNVRYQHNEPSLNLCGFALSACLQMGLHHPDRLEDYGVLNNLDSSMEPRMTWMALFQISTFTSFTLGTPPLIQSPAHLESIRLMCRNPSIPRDFVVQIEIQRHVARYISTLENQTDLQARFSITQVFDRELDSIRAEFQDAWSATAEFNLLIAKLYLYAMFISPKSDQGPTGNVLGGVGGAVPQESMDMGADTNRRMILNLGLATVVKLVQVFRTQCGYPSTTQPSTPSNIFATSSSSTAASSNATTSSSTNTNLTHIEFFPKFYFRSLVFAACYLLYFLFSTEESSLSTSPGAATSSNTSSSEKTARTHIDIIHSIFKAYDIQNLYSHNGRESKTYDVYRHAAETIDTLREAILDGNSGDKGVALERWRVESRMGAGIFFGAVRMGWDKKMGWDKRSAVLRREWEGMSGVRKEAGGVTGVEAGNAGMTISSSSEITQERELQGNPGAGAIANHTTGGVVNMPMDLVTPVAEGGDDFFWDQQQLSADQWNFQWGIWGMPLMTPFGGEQEIGGEGFGDGNMGAFSQP